jgi:lipid-A-disaccharide synthase
MVEEIPPPPSPKEAPGPGEPFDILLFPGSRRQEVSRHIEPMLGAAGILRERWPECRIKVGAAPLIDEGVVRIPERMRDYVTLTRNGIEELAAASLVIASSGTVTLQTALSGTPMVVLYRTSMLTYMLARSMVRIPWIAMPNLLAGERIVPELIQGEVEATRIAEEAVSLLSDGGLYRRTSSGLLSLRDSLTRENGLDHLSRLALSMADGDRRVLSSLEENAGGREGSSGI